MRCMKPNAVSDDAARAAHVRRAIRRGASTRVDLSWDAKS
jgi:hypothetical protein